MKFRIALLFVIGCVGAAALYAATARTREAQTPVVQVADQNLPTDNNYVVHEWGTFTSFSGSDGVAMDFRTQIDLDLPRFVMDRPRQALLNQQRDIAFNKRRNLKGEVMSRQRMETPVTYFYTDKERIVDVKVDFPKGLLTEFFPPVRQFGPAYKPAAPEPLENSFLRWGKIRLLPETTPYQSDPYIPKVIASEGAHYAHARETDSARVQITDPATGGTHREKFLFYRGVGNFNLPVTLVSAGEDRFTLTNSGADPLSFAFIIQADKQTLRFARYDRLKGTTTLTLPKEGSSFDALAAAMVAALSNEGLYEKEARAMVKTWQSNWFSEQGTRVLYSLPQSHTDTLLPLTLSPAPRQALRVMIGRLETLTPQQEQHIEATLAKLRDADPDVRGSAMLTLRGMGRFVEPAVARVMRQSNDPEAVTAAKELLEQLLRDSASGFPN